MVLQICILKTIIPTLFISIVLHVQCECRLTPGTCGIKPASCSTNLKYRSYSGSCNNLQHPTWGMPLTRYNRLLPPKYRNGTNYPTVAKSGNPLPGARKVSLVVYPNKHKDDPNYTLLAMQYGQVMAHDMSMTMGNNQIKPETQQCCSNDGQLLKLPSNPDYCYPIMISKNDPVYSPYNIQCIEFERTGTDRDFGCGLPNQHAEQLSSVNHYLDLSLVYGQDDDDNEAIRLYQGGKLKFEVRNAQKWLPRNKNVSGTCMVADSSEPCYMAGDVRVNQNPQLTVLQTILLREHNRIADVLANLNPQWDDEELFQEARKIAIGQHQKIASYEWLPLFLGEQNVLKKKITYPKTNEYINDYDPNVDPSILNEHATAAFRFFHSNIAGYLDLINKQRQNDGEVRISDYFNRPKILESGSNNFDDLTLGFATQSQSRADVYHTPEITNNWNRQIGKKVGQDLKAICIQRNRDHGLASYNDLREYCGLKRAVRFKDLEEVISKDNIKKLKSLYEHPDDIDLTVGGSLEELVPGTQAGPTFLCIITEQFRRTRVGDRFYFENAGDTGFTLPKLREIRKASISRLLCDNTDIKMMQPQGFKKISKTNELTSCQALPHINLSLWKEN